MEACIGRKNAWSMALEILETKQPLSTCTAFEKGQWSSRIAYLGEELVPVYTAFRCDACLLLTYSISLRDLTVIL